AVRLLAREPWRPAELRARSAALRAGLRAAGAPVPDDPSPIVPVRCGGASEALSLAEHLAHQGYCGVAIRPPTVPKGTARLRLSVSSAQCPEALRALPGAVASWPLWSQSPRAAPATQAADASPE
ncbi:MAG: aminotransferase class I/II-fold pyridoxal phosphate-dependent enzyme, partial [Candidatus Sumerlaeia bacterium]|nr:aminotransferase class I/II-fold pyridoxal phosphate-dependent enzyme [Candidatus Sumerlaeia bacterium]